MTMQQLISILLIAMLVAGCGRDDAGPTGGTEAGLDDLAREYLFLELAMGQHDPAHVDAYFGPESIREEAEAADATLGDIRNRAAGLVGRIEAHRPGADAETLQRIDGLLGRLRALDTRALMAGGETLSFDEESRRLFGAVAPDHDAAHFEAILAGIDALLGGEGDLSARVNAFRDRFVIPPDRLAEVFDAAIAECRRRTLDNMTLPDGESFTLEYVTDKPWSGYNWYQGNSQSLIQINTDLPIYISRAVDLGCHEGYPGHHTFNALLEQYLVRERGWLEFTLYPLFSPQSLIAEGSGNYGIDLAFPGDQRIEFEKTVLFPLAGLDAGEADRYYALLELLARLDYAGNEAARDYLNGTIDRAAAEKWLVDYALSSPERAAQRVDFFDTYRSYVINYNLGKDLVRDYVERGDADAAERWRRFGVLLSSPMSAADL